MKYRSVRTNGFPSKLESALYDFLLLKEKAGEIKNIKLQQAVILQEGPPKVRISWKVDFSSERADTGETVYHEAKGIETSDYKLKLKLWRKNPPARLEVYKGTYKRLFLALVIDPTEG